MTAAGEVLVTGAAGFIGRHTVAALHRAGHAVTAVDLRPAPGHLVRSARWRRGDFADPALLSEVAAGRYEAVLHQGGISDTRAVAGPELEETNTLGPLRLAEACRSGGTRLVYASSHSVYGMPRDRAPLAEEADEDRGRCSGPLNPYAWSKLALDRQMRERFGDGLDWVGLRYTNVFGADEDDKGPMASILSQLLRQAADRGRVRVFDDSLTAARDYIPAETVAATLVLLARRRVPAAVYNLGAGHAVSFAEVVQWCARLYREAGGGPLEVRLVPNPVTAAYQYYTCADMTALDKALPDRPTVAPSDVEARVTELFKVFRRDEPRAMSASTG
ncbi:NAD-dependent epimerase/dehydratase family protein [Streptomyces sp. P1-3]|uniref:NAD-dependent epimerase/dehydratase family protein n=1 Tax=Streptomyces sp. P1-3 TaxID=3421658 RepID=UPI003D36257E